MGDNDGYFTIYWLVIIKFAAQYLLTLLPDICITTICYYIIASILIWYIIDGEFNVY